MISKNKYKKMLLIGSMIGLLSTACSNEKYEVSNEEIVYETNDDIEEEVVLKEQNSIPKYKPTIIKTTYAILTDNDSIYLGPDLDYDKVCDLNKGEKVELISKSIDDWYIVRYKDNYGFTKKENLNLDNTIIPQDDIPYHTYNIVVATSDVNVRKKDDINSERLTLLPKGEELPLLADMENGWYKVKYNEEEAYLRKEFVYENIKTELANKYYKVICLKNTSNLITDTEEIELPKYECGKVFNETDNYYLIETNNTIGYISKENLLELKDRFVIVDISDQKLELYENNEVTFTSDVVTGRPHHETDMGIESVLYKQRNRTLRGRGYASFVRYWMKINGNAEGLHDASWRSEFGGDIYETNGSHGCVNLPTDSAAFLYDKLSVGDRVIVKK